MNIKVNDELKEEIIKFYRTKPMSYATVQEAYGLCQPTISKILKNEVRYRKNLIFNPELKEDFFEKINDEYKAYFLGLMISDGNVFIEADRKNNRQASISITLNEDDSYILEEFKRIVKTNTAISSDGRGCSYVAVRSNKLASDLATYGVVPRKTSNTFLPQLNSDLMPHLIRGILDGDGSIGAHLIKSGRFLHYISFCGTERLMCEMSDFLYKTLNLNTKPKIYTYKDKQLSEFSIRKIEDMKKVGDYLYNDANIFFIRKKNTYDFFLQHYNLKYGNTEVSSEITQGSETP